MSVDLKITQERERITRESWHWNFDYAGKSHWGYSFPCNADGTLLPLESPGQKSLDYCHAHPEEFEAPYIQRYENSFMQEMIGVCLCGREVFITDTLWNGCDCGRWYDFGGHQIQAPRGGGYQYETGETLADIYNGKDEDY